MKQDFYQRIVAEQMKRAKIVNKIRDHKEKIIQTQDMHILRQKRR